MTETVRQDPREAFAADSPLADEVRPAASCNLRKEPLDILMLHYTGMQDGEKAVERLCCAESGVSCHYLVHEDGRIVQMVRESDRAWHAGAGSWRGSTDINSRSIGIEISNPGHEFDYPDFPEVQIRAVTSLCRDILGRHAIPPRNVIAHSDSAPGRKADPGEKFPWARLAAEGIGLWVEPDAPRQGRTLMEGDVGACVESLQAMLRLYGYGIGSSGRFGVHTRNCVAAFQRHFRQGRVDGIADESTMSSLFRLIGTLSRLT